MLEDWARSLKNPHKARNFEQIHTGREGAIQPDAGAGFFFFSFLVFFPLVFGDFKLICSCSDP